MSDSPSLDHIEATLNEILACVRALAEHASNREKNERENEKRDIPPTPPIESKEKEREEKRQHTHTARERNEVKAINKEADALFADFWSKYPVGHKTNKKECRKKLRSRYRKAYDAGKSAEFVNAFLSGLERWLASKRWSEGFVINPESYINQERWLDAPEPSRDAREKAKESEDRRANDRSAEILKGLGL